jgi:hypothetical protein
MAPFLWVMISYIASQKVPLAGNEKKSAADKRRSTPMKGKPGLRASEAFHRESMAADSRRCTQINFFSTTDSAQVKAGLITSSADILRYESRLI